MREGTATMEAHDWPPAARATPSRGRRGWRAVVAWALILVVAGGGWALFARSALYRRLDPLRVPWLLALYVLPPSLWTRSPDAVVLWLTTQGIRADIPRGAEVAADPEYYLAHAHGTPLTILNPGRWTIRYKTVGSRLIATSVGTGTVEPVNRARSTHGTWAESWDQAAEMGLIWTSGGWRVAGLTALYARHGPPFRVRAGGGGST